RRRGAQGPQGHARADAHHAPLLLDRRLPAGAYLRLLAGPGPARDVVRPDRLPRARGRAAVAAFPRPHRASLPGSRRAGRLSYALLGGAVETFLPIIRNAVIILASLAALAAAGVAIGT